MSENARTVLGVLGHFSLHSHSPELVGKMSNPRDGWTSTKNLFPNIEDFPAFSNVTPNCRLNVTSLFHFRHIVPFCMSEEAERLDAVNTLVKTTRMSDTTPTFGVQTVHSTLLKTVTNAHLCLARVVRQCTTFWLVWA